MTTASAAAADSRNGDELEPRRRRWPLWLAAIVVLALVALVAWAIGRSGSSERAAGTSPLARTTTVRLERRDLSASKRFDGTLGYADTTTVRANRTSVVTREAAEGATLTAGHEVLRLGEAPIFLATGAVPAWRTMRVGIPKGIDVLQLERNLRALGDATAADLTVDRVYDADTAKAVKKLQDRLDLDQTGVIDAGQLVFEPGPVRVARQLVAVGGYAPEGTPLVELTSTRRVVRVGLDASDADIAHVGDAAQVALPSGTRVDAKITKVGAVAVRPAGQPDADPQVTVELTLTKSSDVIDQLDEAPVDVYLTHDQAKNVLVAPVTALVALREGGYAVEVRKAGGGTKLYAAQPGLYADGDVELTGRDLRAGMRVVVPT